MKILLKVSLLLVALFGSSCNNKKAKIWSSTGKLKVVATTTMVADLVRQIGGDKVEVYGLMDEGIDPHSYSGKASDTNATKSADLVVFSGLDLEHKLAENLQRMDNSLAVTAGMDKESLIYPEADLSKYADPHVWGDPQLWAETINPVVGVLSKADPENADYYKKRGEAYRDDLGKLHLWSQKRLAGIPAEHRVLVTSHDAFMYFSRAYDLEVRAIDGLAPGDKAGPKKVQELIKFIKERKLKMIFAEHAVNAKSVQSIAQDAEVAVSEKVLFSDATGVLGEMETVNGETYDVGTYIGMQKHNVNAIVEGLK